MNKLKGHISGIRTHGNLSLITVALEGRQELQAIVIDTPETADYLREGQAVFTLFKETEVVLSLGDPGGITIQNTIPCTIEKIETGEILSRLEMHSPAGTITGILPASCASMPGIKTGQNVIALVKFNEIMLSVE